MTNFHINPKTGIPGECLTTQGECLFGGAEAHYESTSDARTAFELSMAGKELKLTKLFFPKAQWANWRVYSSGALIRTYGETTGFIALGAQGKYSAYGKGYNPIIGPASYRTEEDAMEYVVESFKEEKYAVGDALPVTIERELFTPYSAESYALRNRAGSTELAIIRKNRIRYFEGLKAITRERAYAELEDYFSAEERKNSLLKNNEVYWIDDARGCFVYVEHAGAIFRGKLKESASQA